MLHIYIGVMEKKTDYCWDAVKEIKLPENG